MNYQDFIKELGELSAFDLEDLIEGYRHGYIDRPSRNGWAGQAYAYGWRWGQLDGGHGRTPSRGEASLLSDRPNSSGQA